MFSFFPPPEMSNVVGGTYVPFSFVAFGQRDACIGYFSTEVEMISSFSYFGNESFSNHDLAAHKGKYLPPKKFEPILFWKRHAPLSSNKSLNPLIDIRPF